ncbi:hypothetical protein LRS13_10250 [Svornostia abyssi]|uniref:Uncharacterized protein n=1 Tax=Svornostia abyssi TaxID=2898438 RepID=A0ABY5PPN1_9ACTN|nr:hypothetical protein LRS13_10250 [Parviterribacteraceae bacterium J379]
MKTTNARTGKGFTMAHAFEAFGQDRAVVDEAYPGDVIGIVNAGDLRVGGHAPRGRAGHVPADPRPRARALRHRAQP